MTIVWVYWFFTSIQMKTILKSDFIQIFQKIFVQPILTSLDFSILGSSWILVN